MNIKKIRVAVLAAAIGLLGSFNLNAQEIEKGAQNAFAPDTNAKKVNALGNYTSIGSAISFASVDMSDVNSGDAYKSGETATGVTIIGNFYDANAGYYRLESIYSGSGTKFAHKKTTITFYSNSSFTVKVSSAEYNMMYDGSASACSNLSGKYRVGNCVSGTNDIVSVVYKNYNSSNKITSQTVYSYGKARNIFFEDYLTASGYKLVGSKLVRINYNILKRNSSGKITAATTNLYHTNGKIKEKNILKDLNTAFDPADLKYSSKTTNKYNAYAKLTSSATYYYWKKYTNGSWKNFTVRSYYLTRSYYGNKRVKIQQIQKRNYKTGKFTAANKLAYRSTGKKYWYKVRTYKAGKAKKQYYTLYNKKGTVRGGGAYKITVNFNKKGKAYSAYKAKYKANGKLKKATKIKLRKSVYSW